MGSVAVLPRTFLHRTRWGTAVFYDRRPGLLACDERTGRWRPISAEELRRGYPEAFAAWLRFAALLPASAALAASERTVGAVMRRKTGAPGSFLGVSVCGCRRCVPSLVTEFPACSTTAGLGTD